MTPIERAARMLCLIDDVDPDSSLGGDGQNFLWMEYAEVKVKPVLREIREASGEMLGDVHDTLLYAVKGEEIETARTVWSRMIDAAIAEKP